MTFKKDLLPHGFKAKAEKKSIEIRRELSLNPYDHLCAFVLAEYLNIKILSVYDLGLTEEQANVIQGTSIDNSEWSAFTLVNINGVTLVVHNVIHSNARQQSNLMHEYSHILCNHKEPPEHMKIKLPSYMRSFDKVQEAEATYLGGALQLPREALIWALKKRMSKNDVADFYSCSIEMVNFRINATGVLRQLNYIK